MIEQFGLNQYVAKSTHRCAGWLDVILAIHLPTISDHALITATRFFTTRQFGGYGA